jgi:carbamoyltransferase
VYPPSSDSLLLGEVASAARRGRVLDLCTGSGIQALLQSGNADTVVAVDINPRAVAVARMNAALNELANIEVREGDLYAPVRGERFDLIVANPPFVTSPYDTAPSFHAGGPTGDRVLRRILRGLADHLAAGGRAFAVAHVGLRRGERLETVADRWFAGFRGQALVLSCETGSAIDLSAAQALFALRGGLAAYRREIDRWHTCLRRRRIETVSLILIAARLGGRHRVEVIDASPRILPLPLAPGPAERIAKWLAG